MWVDHPNLTPEVNRAIKESELSGGIWWKDLPVGSKVIVRTRNTRYEIENREDGSYIQGHEKYCPQPTKASIHGSTFGGSMIKAGWLGVGMYLEFSTDRTITTSQIQDVQEIGGA